jgi:hypothetical protein
MIQVIEPEVLISTFTFPSANQVAFSWMLYRGPSPSPMPTRCGTSGWTPNDQKWQDRTADMAAKPREVLLHSADRAGSACAKL